MGEYMQKLTGAAVIGLALASGFAFSATANAADIYGGRGSVKDGPVAAFGPNWAGLYVGGSAGYAFGDSSLSIVGQTVDVSPEGATLGAYLGYNFQRGPIVFGVEASLNSADVSDTFAVVGDEAFASSSTELTWYGTAVGRLGYSTGNTLFYGFGGVAFGNVKTRFDAVAEEATFGTEDEQMHVGWTAGAGIERAFTDRVGVRLEYAHVDLGREDTFGALAGLGGEISNDLSFDTVKLGVSYKLTSEDALESLK